VSYQLSIELKAGYLHCRVTGENTTRNVAGYMEEVMRECATRGVPRVLIEEQLTGPRLPTFEVFAMVSRGTVRFQRTLIAMAYVDVNAVGDGMRFAEDVAVNRGFPVRVFTTVAAAEEWLTREYPSDAAATRPPP
jgi:hypothetical protein